MNSSQLQIALVMYAKKTLTKFEDGKSTGKIDEGMKPKTVMRQLKKLKTE